MHDFLSEVSEMEFRAPHGNHLLHHSPIETLAKNPADLFVYDDYDWDGFKVEGQVVLKLTQGFFTFVSECDMAKLDGRPVCANVWRCPQTNRVLKVYAVLRDPTLGKRVYLHRYLVGAKNRVDIVDHVNNWPLDNRSEKNLWSTSKSMNGSNRIYTRSNDLPRGVKSVGSRFQGQIWHKGEGYFSKVVGSVEEARSWYLEKYKKFYGKVLASGKRPERNYPMFPPRKDEGQGGVPF